MQGAGLAGQSAGQGLGDVYIPVNRSRESLREKMSPTLKLVVDGIVGGVVGKKVF